MTVDVFAWFIFGVFVSSVVIYRFVPRVGGRLGGVGWFGFAVFWGVVLRVFVFPIRSPVETVAAILGIGVCLLIGWRLLSQPESALHRVTVAVAVAGGIYLMAGHLLVVRSTLIEVVAAQTHWVLGVGGVESVLQERARSGLVAELQIQSGEHFYTTYLVFACTGIGAMAAFTGLIAAVDTSPVKRLRTMVIVLPIIWVLNVIRNVFIAAAFGQQWFQLYVPSVLALTGYQDPGLVSYFIADRVIAQSVSVGVIVGLTLLTARLLPEFRTTGAAVTTAIQHPVRRGDSILPPAGCGDGGDHE